MSTSQLVSLQTQMRWRHALALLAWALPLLASSVFVATRLISPQWVIAIGGCTVLAIGLYIAHMSRAVNRESIVRALDAAVPSLDDSSDLLLRDASELSDVQRLQRARVIAQLDRAQIPDLRPAWPWRRIFAACFAASLMVATSLWPQAKSTSTAITSPSAAAIGEDFQPPIELQSANLRIEAPAYTGIAARDERTLDAKFPAGSQLNWSLAFTAQVQAVNLEFLDGSHLALQPDAGHWVGTRRIDESSLYRIVTTGVPALTDERLYRLDAIVDQAPEIRVTEPDRTLTALNDEQASWNLAFEASDDYGVADARVQITLAQGSGEQVTVKEQSINLRAASTSDPRLRSYRHRVDLRVLGFAQGDDVIVRFAVTDTRKPQPNTTRSASYILRWPADLSADAKGIDGIVQKVLPAYFRSQRQIIIDSEALLGEKANLSAGKFLSRSDAIGVDQKILRLRYGQFLGEEFESGGSAKSNDKPKPDDKHDDEVQALPEGHHHDDGHDHAKATFGDADAAIAEFGHTHDHAEAATLLDPETKRILKAALEEMWQAEMHLRLGDPARALPYENRALAYIKQVQQSTRIYLARVGLELPPVDETRRLSGDRSGIGDRRGNLKPAERGDHAVREAWNALEATTSPDFDALMAWLDANGKSVGDRLAMIAAIDALRRDEACQACAQHLQDLLWPLLPKPMSGAKSRSAPDAAGNAYLKILSEGTTP